MAYLIDAGMGPSDLHTHSTSSACQRAAEQVYSLITRIAVSSPQHACLLHTQFYLMRQLFENTITVLHALGSSTNDNVHLLAIADRMPGWVPYSRAGARLKQLIGRSEDVDARGRAAEWKWVHGGFSFLVR